MIILVTYFKRPLQRNVPSGQLYTGQIRVQETLGVQKILVLVDKTDKQCNEGKSPSVSLMIRKK